MNFQKREREFFTANRAVKVDEDGIERYVILTEGESVAYLEFSRANDSGGLADADKHRFSASAETREFQTGLCPRREIPSRLSKTLTRAQETPTDCLIIGAGPAGLTAAVYLARFRRSVTVIDCGESRAARIPLSHNIPGMSDGLGGNDLLERHLEQASVYGVTPHRGTVSALAPKIGGGFVATVDDGSGGVLRIKARTVLVATGVRDREPALPNVENAIMRGLVRHCPVCDAFEVTDQNIAVLGQGAGAIGEAIFMRTYSQRVTLLLLAGADILNDEDRQQIAAHDIRLVEEPITTVAIEGDRISALTTGSGTQHRFDTLYSALGADARSEIALSLGADHEKTCNAIFVDDHQRTSVPGMWAAGDVVSSLNQVAVAWGQAAVAATDIHNQLRDLDQKATVDELSDRPPF